MPDQARIAREQRTSYLSAFIRWLQLKKYQYEVTFSLYMLTPTEKFIFNLILFVLVSMLVTAASLYLPDHVAVIYNRIWYYVHGEFSNITANGGHGDIGVGKNAHLLAQSVSSVSKIVAATAESTIRRGGEL